MNSNLEIYTNALESFQKSVFTAQDQARVLLSNVCAEMSRSVTARPSSWKIDTYKNDSPGARTNDVYLDIRYGDVRVDHLLRVRVYIDHTIQNPNVYDNGSNFKLTAYRYGPDGAFSAYAMEQGWYTADGRSIAAALTPADPSLKHSIS